MALDTYAAAEILATCNALGSEIHGEYIKNSDCLTCLKDLIRFLKRDDDHSILRQLGEIQVLRSDLFPILKQYSNNKEIFDMTLRLIVILTHPAVMLYNEEIPDEKLAHNIYLSIVSYHQSYKQFFTDSEVWSVFEKGLKRCLSVSYAEREDEDRLIIERILIIVRNILHLPSDDMMEQRTDDDVNVRDQVVWAMQVSGITDVILFLASNEKENEYCLHVLEVISLLLREQTPKILATAGKQRELNEIKEDEKKLVAIRQREMEEKLQREKKLNCRRFNGVYYVKNMKSISERDHISHKLISKEDTMKFDSKELTKRIPKNRLPLPDNDISRRSTLSIRLFLKGFCGQFIKYSYNTFMCTVKRHLMHKNMDSHDDSYYLWAIKYFLEFNRLTNCEVGLVSETLSTETFHYIQTQVDSYYDHLSINKKEVKLWSRRMHLGLKAYKELLETLRVMRSGSDEQIRKSADIILSNVFYIVEYREMLLSLLTRYDEMKFSKAYLVDLIETIHIFLKMFDSHGKTHFNFVVQKKKRKNTKRKKKAKKSNTEVLVPLQEQWDTISNELSDALQGKFPLPEDNVLFDAASSLTSEEQKMEVVFKIRNTLLEKNTGKCVSLLRAARELWPEDDTFGAVDILPEDEFLLVREIFMTELPKTQNPEPMEVENAEELQEEEMEAMSSSSVVEQHLDFKQFLHLFATSKVIKPCCNLLENYQKNSASTNNAILKLMHRLAWDCKMHTLFFQATLFLTFKEILKEAAKSKDPLIKELSRFAKFILGKFFEVAETNKKVFAEMLFWKSSKDAYEIEEGYGSFSSTATKLAWSEEEEQQLKELYEDMRNGEDYSGDVIDGILEKLGEDRSRKGVIAKLKKLGCITSAQEVRPTKTAASEEWEESEIIALELAFQQHKEADDVVTVILSDTSLKRSKKAVTNKLLELNLVSDVSELKKKKFRGPKIVHIL